MSLTKVTSSGLQHGLINTVGNSVPDDGFKHFSEANKVKMQALKKSDAELVKVQYLHKDGKNERLERPYMKYSGQSITTWRLLHGETYDMPRGLANDINDPNKREKKRSGFVQPNGEALLMDQLEDPIHRVVGIGF
jgi:hypothetical protein